MKNDYKFILLESISTDGDRIYRYTSKAHKDLWCWRISISEARGDFYRFYLNIKDTARGMNEIMKFENIKKYNKNLILK